MSLSLRPTAPDIVKSRLQPEQFWLNILPSSGEDFWLLDDWLAPWCDMYLQDGGVTMTQGTSAGTRRNFIRV